MLKLFGERDLKNNKGFTLTEIIIVISILGILAAIATPSIFGYIEQSQARADQSTAIVIQNAIQMATVNNTNLIDNNSGTAGNLLFADANAVKSAISETLTGGAIPAPKQSGYSFYLYTNKNSGYSVVAYKNGELIADLRKFYPTVPGIPDPNGADANCRAIRLNP